jgi:hypothetical protein
MQYTPNFSFTWKALLITLIGSTMISPVMADLAIEWSYTVKAEDFGIPIGYSATQSALQMVPATPRDGEKTWINTSWTNGDGDLIRTIAIVGQEGDLLARKRMLDGEYYSPLWIHDEVAILEHVFLAPHERQDSFVVWRFDENGGVSEEPFPFAGAIQGGNTKGGVMGGHRFWRLIHRAGSTKIRNDSQDQLGTYDYR